MAHNDDRAAPARQLPFTLYAANGRVYARNRDQKIIDLGALTHQDAAFCYLLDGNKQGASGFFTEEEALRDVAGHLRFLWLDGQFTALADAKDDPGLNLDGAVQLDIELDELPPGERMIDATV
jgi:hypothetical protein